MDEATEQAPEVTKPGCGVLTEYGRWFVADGYDFVVEALRSKEPGELIEFTVLDHFPAGTVRSHLSLDRGKVGGAFEVTDEGWAERQKAESVRAAMQRRAEAMTAGGLAVPGGAGPG